MLEWLGNEDGKVTVRRAERYSSEDIHAALFGEILEAKTVEEMNADIVLKSVQ